MKRRVILDVERELATVRRAMYRAIGYAEQMGDSGLEDDLHQINAELARLMAAVMKDRARA